jgi:O-antigen/teichoic acid export membrane protein
VLRHSFLNLLGLGLPLVVAIAAIPLLIDALGVERFGILTLIWALVSYFGLFDLGLGRALTRELAANRAHGEPATARRLASTALAVMGVLGLAAGVLLALGAESAGRLFGSEHNPSEVVHAVYAMAVAMPFILTTSGLRGILEADQAFGIVNAIRVPLGVYTFLAPVAVVHYWSNDLGLVAASLTGGRMLAYFAHAWFCRRATATGADRFRIDRGLLAVLLHSGGWMTVSNIISPLMAYLDRYIIALTISVTAVAYYATPYEVITKLWIIPGALTAVLLPRFARASAHQRAQDGALLRRSTLLVFSAVYPLALGIALFSRELLELWLGGDFAARSYPLLQVFAFGILANCLAHIPFTFLQGIGRADITARLHALEFPLFVLLLWLAAQSFGLFGAALAWLLRILVDTGLLFYFSGRKLDGGCSWLLDVNLLLVLLITVGAFAGISIADAVARLVWGLAAIALVYTLCWKRVLNRADRAALLQRFPDAGV